MACNCGARRQVIVAAVKNPKTALTAVKFVAKSSGQDIAASADRLKLFLRKRGLQS